MTVAQIDTVQRLEDYALTLPQVDMQVKHFLHAGMYTRSLRVPKGHVLTGALIRVETNLVIAGNAKVFIGDEFKHYVGYHVIPCSANRKQVFIAIEETWLTMYFHTNAKTVKQAEEQFTDEWRKLTTRIDEG